MIQRHKELLVDLLYLAMAVLFFALADSLVSFCDRIQGGGAQ
jgi:hypothetical protein